MVSFTSTSLLLSLAVGSMAVPSHQLRNVNHSDLAKRVEGALSKRATFTANRVTWYGTDTGPDACTGRNHRDSDNIVAMNMPQFGSNGKGVCGRKIRITANGKSAIGVVQDACASCPEVGQIDLTKSLFQQFASLDKGVFKATWSFVDDEDDDDEPATTKKTTTAAPKTTTKATTTTRATEKAPTTTATTSTKKDTPSPTKETTPTPTHDTSDDDDDDAEDDEDDEDCEEYEDDDEEEEEPHKPVAHTPPPPPAHVAPPPPPVVHTTHTRHTTHSTPSSSSTPLKAATVPHVKVDSTPSPIATTTSSFTTISLPTPPAGLAPTDAVANPGAEPSPSQDASNIAGGISSDGIGNSAVSLGQSTVLSSIFALAVIAIQAL